MIWVLRGVFAVLILLTVGWKLAASPAPVRAGDTARRLEAVLQGRAAGAVTGQTWSAAISIYAVPVSGCAAPLMVVTTPPNFSAATVMLRMQRPGDHHLYAYRDWMAAEPQRWVVLRRQLWDKALVITGLDRHTNTDTMLFIAEPAGCAVARDIPWARFWDAQS